MIDDPVFLYVEDDPGSKMVIEILIRRVLGYDQITVFDDSQDFANRVKALDPRPNVIFLDIQIAPMDGYEMLRVLRVIPEFKDAIIIAMTANVMSHDVEKLQGVGFHGLIGKPILKDIFSELVKRILAGENVWYVP